MSLSPERGLCMRLAAFGRIPVLAPRGSAICPAARFDCPNGIVVVPNQRAPVSLKSSNLPGRFHVISELTL